MASRLVWAKNLDILRFLYRRVVVRCKPLSLWKTKTLVGKYKFKNSKKKVSLERDVIVPGMMEEFSMTPRSLPSWWWWWWYCWWRIIDQIKNRGWHHVHAILCTRFCIKKKWTSHSSQIVIVSEQGKTTARREENERGTILDIKNNMSFDIILIVYFIFM